MKSIRITQIMLLKKSQEKICCLTAYDASFAHIISALVEVILIGDSLGMVVQGQPSTVPVTMEHMVYHTELVARGNQGALLIGDMPFMSYATFDQTLQNATRLMQAGAHMVKLEGGAFLAPVITRLTDCGIPVCGHLGLTPQSVNVMGGYKIQGKDEAAASQLKTDALALQAAGIQMLVIECVPAQLGKELSTMLSIPVIGIGAGCDTDGQILVLYDMLGITAGRVPKFTKNFMSAEDPSVQAAVQRYVHEVKQRQFPGKEHEVA